MLPPEVAFVNQKDQGSCFNAGTLESAVWNGANGR